VSGVFLSGEAWALAFDPRTGDLWTANQFRTFRVGGYATMRRPASNAWWGNNDYLPALWSPLMNPFDGRERDNVMSLSFCDDGTMWVASLGHGLARVRDGAVSYLHVPGGDGLFAVACDPSDNSVWVGSAFDGGIWRLKDGAWTSPPPGAPAFTKHPVRSIQIDRWASPRIVYFSHLPQRTPAAVLPGGLTAYAGP
jgi:hypothetical protein